MTKLKSQYFKSVKEELKGKLYSTNMNITKDHWVYCYFLSKQRDKVYQLCLSTSLFELQRKLMMYAEEHVAKSDPNFFDFEKQSSELLLEARKVMKDYYQQHDVQVFERCVKIHSGNYHEIIKCVIDVPVITKKTLTKCINSFLEDEIYWYSSKPVKFSTEQLNLIFNI